jgi:hypothetical protein
MAQESRLRKFNSGFLEGIFYGTVVIGIMVIVHQLQQIIDALEKTQ